MSLHADLLSQAEHLVRKEPSRPRQASLRRAVSSTYYALFHLLIHEASSFLTRGSQGLKQLISRAFEHSEMKSAAKAFAGGTLKDNIGVRIGSKAVPGDLQRVAQAFVDLQEARHEADYDLSSSFKKRDAADLVEVARRAFEAWKRVKKDPAARAFLICLLTYNRVSKR